MKAVFLLLFTPFGFCLYQGFISEEVESLGVRSVLLR